jgi:hypothetical protein
MDESRRGHLRCDGIFDGIDPHPTTTDLHVLLNNVSLFNAAISSFGVPVSFSLAGALAAGDRLDFVVGFGTDMDFGFDSTGLKANISFAPSAAVPEPGSLLLVGSGFLVCGRRWRRNGRKTRSG